MNQPARKPFSVKNANISGNYNRDRPSAPGRYLCRVEDVREQSGHKGHGFWLDLEAVKGPCRPGFKFSYANYPENAQAQGNLSREQVYQKEMGKIMLAVAACLGFGRDRVAEVDDEVYAASLGLGPDGLPANKNSAGYKPSKFKGRLVVYVVKPYTNKKTGKDTTFHEIEPYVEGELFEEYVAPVASAKAEPEIRPAPAKKGPPAPPKKDEKPSFEDAMLKAGFELHSEAEGYVWNPSTDEVIETSELQARLGY